MKMVTSTSLCTSLFAVSHFKWLVLACERCEHGKWQPRTKESILLSFWHNSEYTEKRRKRRKNICYTVANPRTCMKLKMLTWQAFRRRIRFNDFLCWHMENGKHCLRACRGTELNPLLCTLKTKYSKSFLTLLALLSCRILVYISPGSFRACAFRWIIYF